MPKKKEIKCGRKEMKIYFDYARAQKKRAVLIEIKQETEENNVEVKRSSYPLNLLFYILFVI